MLPHHKITQDLQDADFSKKRAQRGSVKSRAKDAANYPVRINLFFWCVHVKIRKEQSDSVR